MLELNGNQTRQLIDSQQVHEASRVADRECRDRYSGSMSWKTVGDKSYLYRKREGIWKSLGPKSRETDKIYDQFHSGRSVQKAKCQSLEQRLTEIAPVNRAMRIGRVPVMSAKILRRIDRMDALGSGLMVVGTHALYAYEMMGGIHFDQDAVATMDIDLLYDARDRVKLFSSELQQLGLLGLLQNIDVSFEALSENAFRAANKDGFMVDLLTPSVRNPAIRSFKSRIGNDDSDLKAVEIEGLKWIENAPSITQCAIDERGFPLTITAPDPRVFACHKIWLSQRTDRDPMKKRRDFLQASEVIKMLNKYLPHLEFSDASLNALPLELRTTAQNLVKELR